MENKTRTENEKIIVKHVAAMMKEIGVPPHLDGYWYIMDAVKMGVNNRDIVKHGAITKQLYPAIGEIHGKTSSQVERAVRNAIHVAFERGNSDKLKEYFGNTIKLNQMKPTNSEFIAALVNEIMLNVEI